MKSIFNAYTNNTQQSTGPKFPDQSYKPEQPKIQNGNIDKDELKKLDKKFITITNTNTHKMKNNVLIMII